MQLGDPDSALTRGKVRPAWPCLGQACTEGTSGGVLIPGPGSEAPRGWAPFPRSISWSPAEKYFRWPLAGVAFIIPHAGLFQPGCIPKAKQLSKCLPTLFQKESLNSAPRSLPTCPERARDPQRCRDQVPALGGWGGSQQPGVLTALPASAGLATTPSQQPVPRPQIRQPRTPRAEDPARGRKEWALPSGWGVGGRGRRRGADPTEATSAPGAAPPGFPGGRVRACGRRLLPRGQWPACALAANPPGELRPGVPARGTSGMLSDFISASAAAGALGTEKNVEPCQGRDSAGGRPGAGGGPPTPPPHPCQAGDGPDPRGATESMGTAPLAPGKQLSTPGCFPVTWTKLMRTMHVTRKGNAACWRRPWNLTGETSAAGLPGC